MSPQLVIAGGGTGGHVLAGIAIADAWIKTSGQTPESGCVVFVGAQGGIEERLVPKNGYPLKLLSIGSLNRVGLRRKMKTLFQLPLSFLVSALWLLKDRPHAVIGVGGYASGPYVLMARVLGWMWGAQVAILEQNAVPGMTNRWLGRFSHQVFAAFPGVESHFSRHKVTVTGNPVRNTIQAMPSALRDPFQIFVFGGSQGALGINRLVTEALDYLKPEQARIRWVHQTGEKDYESVRMAYQKKGWEGRIERFIDDMPEVYRASSLLICRAGSSTLSEIAAARRAAILIPLPTAADNHQEKNARLLVDQGGALLLKQQETTGQELAKKILDLLSNPSQLNLLEDAVGRFYRPGSAESIVSRLRP